MTEGYDVAAARWVSRVSDPAIAMVCGDFALERGLGYADAERVQSISTGDQGRMLLAVVNGSRSHPYSTMITSTGQDLADGPEWSGRCSCPVQVNCKHVAAVLLVGRDALGGSSEPMPYVDDTLSWRTVLAPVVAERESVERTQIGLFVGIQQRPSSLYDSTPRRVIEIRPTRATKTGRWSRTAGWADFRFQHTEQSTEKRQLQVIRELHRLADTVKLPFTSGARRQVLLDDLPAEVWGLLSRAVDAGIQLLPAPDSLVKDVSLLEPAEVSMRLDPDESGALALSVDLDHGALGETSLMLGDPAHGVAVLDGYRLSLVPFAQEPDELTSQLIGKPPVLIPAEEVSEFTALYLPGLRERSRVIRPGEDGETEADRRVRMHLLVTSMAPGHVEIAQTFLYGADHRVPVMLDAREPGRRRRDEHALVATVSERLERLGLLSPVGGLGYWPSDGVALDGMDAVRFIATMEQLGELDEFVVEVQGEVPTFEEATAEPLIQLSTVDSDAADWFDLHITVTIDQEKVPFEPLFTALARGEDHMVLFSGTYFSLTHPSLLQLKELILEARSLADPTSKTLQLNKFQVGLWEELVSLGVIGEQSSAWESSVDRLRQLDKIVTPERPAGFAAELRPYQDEGFAWLSTLWDAQLGGVLADDMGLGKTVQTLAMLAKAHEAGEIGGDADPVLVVAPTSVVGTWASEAAKFAPDIPVVTVTETSKKRGRSLAEMSAGAGIVVTSYAVLRLDADSFHGQSWRGLVLDEAQMVKNHQSKTYQAARKVGAPFTLAISGTPLENSLMDLWSLLSLTAPGLYPKPEEFTEHYRRPIESGASPEKLDQLRRRIRPLMLRRTKSQVAADLPEKQIQVMPVDLQPVHSRIYDAHLQRERQRIMGLLGDPDANRVAILASLTRLRQLALDPALVDDSYAGIATSAKVTQLIEQLREISGEGHRALVFSQFTGYLRMVEKALGDAGLSTCYLDGSMTSGQRTAEIDAFKTGDANAFLISLKAGGVGLTLTEADYVFVLDPWWNPAAEAQAIDRTHRIGQDKPVMVYRMVSRGTIEEKVVALQDRKRDLFDRVIDDGGALQGKITADDIRALLD